jgi:hypothetical protein
MSYRSYIVRFSLNRFGIITATLRELTLELVGVFPTKNPDKKISGKTK